MAVWPSNLENLSIEEAPDNAARYRRRASASAPFIGVPGLSNNVRYNTPNYCLYRRTSSLIGAGTGQHNKCIRKHEATYLIPRKDGNWCRAGTNDTTVRS